MSWKNIRKFLPLIGIGIFIYLLIKLDLKQIILEIGKINLLYFPIILVLICTFFCIQTLKWFVIARKQKINISFIEALRIDIVSNFYGFITPAKLGSAIRVNYLKEKGAETGKGLSNFVIDKGLDLISVLMLVVFFGTTLYKGRFSSWIYWIIFVLLLGGFFLFYNKRTSKFCLKLVYKIFIPKKMKERSKELFEAFYKDFPPVSFLLFVLGINLFCWILNYFTGYIIGLSLGINIGFLPYLVILPISTLVAQIPITINGFGTRELTLINLFSLFGVEKVKVFSMSLIGTLLLSIIPALISLFLLFKKKKNEIH